jgi:hypothetical protein
LKLEVQIGTWTTVIEDAPTREKGKIEAIRRYREEKDSKIPTSILLPYTFTHRVDEIEKTQEYIDKLEEVYTGR